jgi:hypothetical protein
VTATGWTYDVIDALTWHRLVSLLGYWRDHPPAHILLQGIAGGLGAKFKDTTKRMAADGPLPNPIVSPQQLIGILQSNGLNFGVSDGR